MAPGTGETRSDIDVLRQRLDREQAARREAEEIAEAATRRLYDKQRELELLGQAAEAANGARSSGEAFETVVTLVCRHASWPVGHAYVLDERGVLVSEPAWHLKAAGYEPFRQTSDGMRFGPGVGLPGRVLKTSGAAWIEDLHEDAGFERRKVAMACGLCSGLAVPVSIGPRVVGVLEFFSEHRGHPGDELLAVITHVGIQLGRVLERSRTQRDLERLASELRERNSELGRSNADLETFAYVASHDMAEPLRTAAGFLERLADGYGEHLDERAGKYLAYASSSLERLQRMLSDMLEYARAGSRGSITETVDLARIVSDALEELRPRIAERGADVEVAPMPVTSCDPGGMTRVFINLLSNALKYARDEGSPQISVSAREGGDGSWEISVADRGVGVPEQARKRIFEMFQRAGARSGVSGTGIGLAVCAKIVQAHGGRIWVEPRPGGGSVFRFTLGSAAAS